MGDRMTLFAMTERAMSAQLVRMNAATSNLANAGSVAGSEEEAYRPIRPVFRAELDRASGLTSVRSDGLVQSQTAPTKRYDPGNPLADETGHVFEAPVDETRDVAGRDGAVAHAPPRCLHLDERFERVRATPGVRVASEPSRTEYPSPDGKGPGFPARDACLMSSEVVQPSGPSEPVER